MVQTLTVKTGVRTEFIELTARIEEAVWTSGIQEGLCHLFVPHTTAGVTINENADPAVKADILMVLDQLADEGLAYRHLEGNSPAHVKATLVGPALTVLISGGRLVLGTWQGIFFCDFDGPRTRRLHLKIVAD